MSQTAFRIDGMTCDHCVQTVTAAIESIERTRVEAVDLATGSVVVTGPATTDRGAVASAVAAAGYGLVEEGSEL